MNQSNRIDNALRMLAERFVRPYRGHVFEIIYTRNRDENNESPLVDYAKCMIKYMSQLDLMAANVIPFSQPTFPVESHYAEIYFYRDRTLGMGTTILYDPSKHRKNRRKKTVHTVFDVRKEYESFITSVDMQEAIQRNGLKTFLKIGDVNDWENNKELVF